MTDEIIETIPEVEEVAQEEAVQEEQIESDTLEDPVTEESEEESKPEKKPRKDLLSRVNQLTKRAHDFERKAIEAENKAKYWEQKAQQSEGGRKELAEHEVDRAQSEAASMSQEAWTAKMEAAKAEIPDYDEVVLKSKAHIEKHVGNAVRESEYGPKLLHFLAKNPAELEQLNDMTERGVLKQIAKLEVMLETKKAPEVRTTKAPDPIKPVTSTRGVVAKQPTEMNNREYQAWRRANGANW